MTARSDDLQPMGNALIKLEAISTLKSLVVSTALTAIILALLSVFVVEGRRGGISLVAAIYTMTVLLVPNGLHLLLCQRLEASLFSRIGAIWGEGKGPRSMDLIRAQTKYPEVLKSIEDRFGNELTRDERDLLNASRRQYELGKKWPIPVVLIWALAILTATL